MLESEGNYTRLFFADERPLIYRSLTYLADRLDPRAFFRVSRKHIVNLNWIEDLGQGIHGGMVIRLKGGERIEMSRRQAQKFRDVLRL